MQRHSPSGFESVPFLQWGSHVGQFYETATDLHDILVPYFKAGLENNEHCLWVTGAPFGASQARAALRHAVPDFDVREASRQIEIADAHEWYAAGAKLDPAGIVDGLMRREQDALGRGYAGLRTNGNCAWVERAQWADFLEYETLVHRAIRGRRMICMCSYCVDDARGADVLDVMERHDLMLPRRGHPIELRPAIPVADGFHGILDVLPAAVYTTDADGYLTYYNEAAARIWGWRPELGRQRWCGSWKIVQFDGSLVPHDQCPMAVTLATGKAMHGMEANAERPDGTLVPCAVYPTPLFDATGKLVGALNLMIDITERKAAEERSRTIAREMHHRVNNTMVTVQAIMNSTLRHATTLAEFKESFPSRIVALAKTHALLVGEVQPTVELRRLLDNELEMFRYTDSRITLSGNKLTLPERLAVPVGMAIHELATNAAKYGALAVPHGALAVEWSGTGSAFELSWRERGVRIEAPPARTGFGTRLLTEILPRQIGAGIEIRYEPDGVAARIVVG